jgi:hypothetical protein
MPGRSAQAGARDALIRVAPSDQQPLLGGHSAQMRNWSSIDAALCRSEETRAYRAARGALLVSFKDMPNLQLNIGPRSGT